MKTQLSVFILLLLSALKANAGCTFDSQCGTGQRCAQSGLGGQYSMCVPDDNGPSYPSQPAKIDTPHYECSYSGQCASGQSCYNGRCQ